MKQSLTKIAHSEPHAQHCLLTLLELKPDNTWWLHYAGNIHGPFPDNLAASHALDKLRLKAGDPDQD
jgi:hypothetical protein